MKIQYKKIIFFFFSALILSGCEKNVISPLEEKVEGMARLSVVNAVPGSPGIDVTVNDSKINGAAIPFSSRFPILEYSLFKPGNYSIKTNVNTPLIIPVLPPNIPFGTVLSTTTRNLESNKYYSLFLLGTPVVTNINTLLIEDNFPVPIKGKAFVRFINTMPDGNAMDLLVGIIPPGSANPTVSNALFSNILRGEFKNFEAMDTTPEGSTYQFQLRINGTTTNVGITLNQTLTEGRYYTVIARGFNNAFIIPGFTPVRTILAEGRISLFVNR